MREKYQGLMEASPDAMVVVDEGGEIVLLNLQAEKQFGYRHDELIGQPVKKIIPQGFAERLIADGTRTAAEALAQQIGTGIELSGRRKDGSEFPIEIMLSPLKSTAGILVTAAIRDISVRKEAERHLAQMEERYRGLMEAAPDAMVVVNEGGKIVLLNLQAEKQFGYRRDELVGQRVKNIIPEGFAERLIADGTRTAAEALAQQIGTGIELSGRRKDGSEFPIEIMLSPLESAEGVLVTAAIRDISVRKEAERHLAQMEGRYRGLLEAAPDAMVVVNEGGEIVLLNLQAEKQFGYHRDELIAQQVKSIIPEGFAERLIADGTRTAAEALAQQIGTGIELSGRRRDGSTFPIEIMLSPLESTEGILVTAAIRDISVRKEAERHLAQMEGRYRGLLEAAPDAMVLVNPDGEIVLLNLQAERQFGYRRDELVGQQVKNIILEGFAEQLIADALRSALDTLPQEVRTGIELKGRHKNGSEFPIEIMLSPLESAEGMLVTMAIRDITTRKQNAAEAREKDQMLSRIFEVAPDAILVVDPDGRITRANAKTEALFGYSRAELAGMPIEVLSPNGLAGTPAGLNLVSDPGTHQRGSGREPVARRKDRTEFPVDVLLGSLETRDGVMTLAVVRDITESRKLAHMKDEFISTVSHELRTPLTSIRGSLGLLAAGHMGVVPAEAQQMLEIAVSNTDRLVRLINDILDIERIESGIVAMERRECQAADLMSEAGESLRPLATKAGVALEVCPCVALLWVDPDRILQILTNLLGNAIKFSPPRSTIRLSGEQEGDELVLTVADQGRGIPPDKLESIFGRFQQVDSSDAREKGGTGLGLAICRTIAHQHGGRLWVESQLGHGSTFFCALPLPPQERAGPSTVPVVSPTVLVCEDDREVSEAVCETLAEHGYRVITAPSGREAVEQAMVSRPDAILLDVMRPQTDGWETMAALKVHPGTRDIPIAVHSATKPPAALGVQKQSAAWREKSGDLPRLLSGLKQALEQRVDACRVMLVEDDPDLARVITTVFERQGLTTALARTAQEAIGLLDRSVPDLVVLDVMVPGGGAFAVAAWLRQHEGYQRLPLVVYTVKDLDSSERQQLDLGRTLFLTKSRVPPDLLEKKVRAILERDCLERR